MEEGSLLQHALHVMERQRDDGDTLDHNAKNVLHLDLYILHAPEERVEKLQKLAHLATLLNATCQACCYPWTSGGEGPVFGIRVDSEGIPHLRAHCRYGSNVNDEWMAIRLVLDFSLQHPNVAVECWDVEDGQVLLIEAAHELPEWADDDENLNRHKCWIMNGQVVLINPPKSDEPFSLTSALKNLQDTTRVTISKAIQESIQKRCSEVNTSNTTHRTALVLPRPVAQLLSQRPELVNCLAAAFEKGAFRDLPRHSEDHSDWVWTTSASLARTHYAMLRTLVTPTWNHESFIPKTFKSAELNRMKRACQNEATPHLQHALQLGVRLTAGLEYVLEQKTKDGDKTMSFLERHVLHHWVGVDKECGGDGQWLIHAWQVGPNHSPLDISDILKCPVDDFELKACYPCPLLHPMVSLQRQIQTELRRKHKDNPSFLMPREVDVDNDSWLYEGDTHLEEASQQVPCEAKVVVPSANNSEQVSTEQQEVLDTMLGKFQDFMDNKSDIDGITHDTGTSTEGTEDKVHINPRVFLNMLHKVLTTSPEHLSSALKQQRDPFFSEEDYAMMDPDDSSSGGEHEMESLMDAMDDEVRATRERDAPEYIVDDAIDEDARVLSNLLQSLEASGGAPGPVMNMMLEMGMTPPVLPSELSDEEDDLQELETGGNQA